MEKAKKRVLSGMQPTGNLHIGHYLGVLTNYASLQSDYDCFFMIADWHSMTVFYPEFRKAHSFIPGLVSDWLAAGIDPEKAVIFLQSNIPMHSELQLILSMYTPVSWLERNPTYKEKQENIDQDIDSHGFLGYPVLQAADILLYNAELVPIGEDQIPHLELTREIARRFNHFNVKDNDIFRLPKPLLSRFPKVLGTDGQKMSKSYGNTIMLTETPEELDKKIRKMKTDTNRIHRNDPGNPENCPVYSYYDFFAEDKKSEISAACRNASIGCIECKKLIIERMNNVLDPFRTRKNEVDKNPDIVADILRDGARKAKDAAGETMERVRSAMGFHF